MRKQNTGWCFRVTWSIYIYFIYAYILNSKSSIDNKYMDEPTDSFVEYIGNFWFSHDQRIQLLTGTWGIQWEPRYERTKFSKLYSTFGWVSGYLIYRSLCKVHYLFKWVFFGRPLAVEFGYLTTKSLLNRTHLNRLCNLHRVPFYMRPIYKVPADLIFLYFFL